MGQQLSFKIPEIDRQATQKNVEEALETYHMYLLTVPEEKLPKVTASFTLVPPSNTNSFHSSTEDIAIDRVDMERARIEYIERIQKAVNRLNKREREMIIKKYFGDDVLFDYEVYNDLGMGETYFSQKFKPRVYYKLALMLRIEVYKSESEKES